MDSGGWDGGGGDISHRSVMITSKPSTTDDINNKIIGWGVDQQESSQITSNNAAGIWTTGNRSHTPNRVWNDSTTSNENEAEQLDTWNTNTNSSTDMKWGSTGNHSSSGSGFENQWSTHSTIGGEQNYNFSKTNVGEEHSRQAWKDDSSQIADGKDMSSSGWGSPNSSPTPNAGTEGWKTSSVAAVHSPGQSRQQTCELDWGISGQVVELRNCLQKDDGVKNHENRHHLEVDGASSLGNWHSGPSSDSLWQQDGKQSWPSSLLTWTGGIHEPTKDSSAAPRPRDSVISTSTTSTTMNLISNADITTSASLPAPSTWAQAAGRGLKPASSPQSQASGPRPVTQTFRDDVIARAVNSRDGWGRIPVRQDTAWDTADCGAQGVVSANREAAVAGEQLQQRVQSIQEKSSNDVVGVEQKAQSAPTNWLPSSTGTSIWESRDDLSLAHDGKPAIVNQVSIMPKSSEIGVTSDGTLSRQSSAISWSPSQDNNGSVVRQQSHDTTWLGENIHSLNLTSPSTNSLFASSDVLVRQTSNTFEATDDLAQSMMAQQTARRLSLGWGTPEPSAAVSKGAESGRDGRRNENSGSLGVEESNGVEASTPTGPDSKAKNTGDWSSNSVMLQRQADWEAIATAAGNWSSDGNKAESSWTGVKNDKGSVANSTNVGAAMGDSDWSEDKLESGRWRGPSVDQSHSNTDDIFDNQRSSTAVSSMPGWGTPPIPSTLSSQGGNNQGGLWIHSLPLEPKAGKSAPFWNTTLDDDALETSSIWGCNVSTASANLKSTNWSENMWLGSGPFSFKPSSTTQIPSASSELGVSGCIEDGGSDGWDSRCSDIYSRIGEDKKPPSAYSNVPLMTAPPLPVPPACPQPQVATSAQLQTRQKVNLLLQQLIEMGFKHESIEASLLYNGMNVEQTAMDLVSSMSSCFDSDCSMPGGGAGRMMRGFSDIELQSGIPPNLSSDVTAQLSRRDLCAFVPPPPSLINPPPPQQQLAGGSGLSRLSGPGSMHSSGLMTPVPWMHPPPLPPPHQRLPPPNLQGIPSPPPRSLLAKSGAACALPPPAGPGGGALTPGVPSAVQLQQQQLIQAQILQQLQMAIQAGLISPQLLSRPPTPSMLISLHQLMQLQNLLQHLLMQRQKLIQTPYRLSGGGSNGGQGLSQQQRVLLDQLNSTIPKISQQIVQQQLQISQLQKTTPPPLPPSTQLPPAVSTSQQQLALPPLQQQHLLNLSPPYNKDLLLKDLAILRMTAPPSAPPPQRLPLIPPGAGSVGSVEQPGVKTLQQPAQMTDENMSSARDNSKQLQITRNSSHLENSSLDSNGGEIADSGGQWAALKGPWSGSFAPASAGDVRGSGGEAVLTTSSGLQVSPTTAATLLDIEEFFPGKLWQGPSVRSADDDPYLTPGTEPFLNPSPSSDHQTGSGAWSASNVSESTWSNGRETSSLSGGATRPPPGLTGGTGQMGLKSSNAAVQQLLNRSLSWAPVTSTSMRGLPGRTLSSTSNTSCLLLKNLPHSMDVSLLKALCSQYGTVGTFHLISTPSSSSSPASGGNTSRGHEAFVSYLTREDAARAQRLLNGVQLASATLSAEFVPDFADPAVVSGSMKMDSPPTNLNSIWSAPALLPSHGGGASHVTAAGLWNNSGAAGNVWGCGKIGGSVGSSWGSTSSDGH